MSPKKKSKSKSKSKKSRPVSPPPRVDLDAPDDELEEQLLLVGGQLEKISVWGRSGGGLVKIEMDGMMCVRQCQLAPELLEKKDRELIEDLLVSAFNDAAVKVRQHIFSFLPSMLGEEEAEDVEEDVDIVEMAKAMAQDKDFMEQLGNPFVATFVEMLSALEDMEDEEPPAEGKKKE
ncbi:MAG TPA: YbaB/EbfC family nucleoid-associated protein [Thermoguttaceae bacterium]|nr:YbaB/EbfC family nucleoid-associated protein [Thermoguttaceae bacterium]